MALMRQGIHGIHARLSQVTPHDSLPSLMNRPYGMHVSLWFWDILEGSCSNGFGMLDMIYFLERY